MLTSLLAARPAGHARTAPPRHRWGAPFWLTTLRLALAPAMLALACAFPSRVLLVGCLLAGLLSDVFDGVLARRTKTSTPWLRRYDSAVDVGFYLAAAGAAWILHPSVVASYAEGIALVCALEAGVVAVGLARFGVWPSVHPVSAKGWGLSLFVAFAALLGGGYARGPVEVALSLGVWVNAEVLAILLLSREAPVDVPSIWHAWRARR